MTPLHSMSKVGSIIILAVFPMMSLYRRFHSAVISCELLKTLYQPCPYELEHLSE